MYLKKYNKGEYENMSLSERQEMIDYIMNNKLGYNENDDPDVIAFVKDMVIHIDKTNDKYFDMFHNFLISTHNFDFGLLDIEGDDIVRISDIKISTDKETFILIVEDCIDWGIDEIEIPVKYINDKIVYEEIKEKLRVEFQCVIDTFERKQKEIQKIENCIKLFLNKFLELT